MIDMKTLTVCEPYAHLIASGVKRVENRTWKTDYRGPLLIHAGVNKKYLHCYQPKPSDPPIKKTDLRFGQVVCAVMLTACLPVRACREQGSEAFRTVWPWLRTHEHVEGPYCWVLENVMPIRAMCSIRGALSIFNVSTGNKAVIEAYQKAAEDHAIFADMLDHVFAAENE